MWACSRTNLLFQGRRQVKGGTRSSLSNIVSAGVRKRSQQYHAGNFHTRQPRVLTSCNRALLISKKARHPIRRRLSTEAQTEASAAASSSSGDIPEPTSTQLRYVALAQVIPFIGFGFMDNAILIIAGDAIDTSLGTKAFFDYCTSRLCNERCKISDFSKFLCLIKNIFVPLKASSWGSAHCVLPR